MVDRPIITKLILTDAELQQIYIKMQGIGFFNYPSTFTTTCPFWLRTATYNLNTVYNFHVAYNNKIKSITWKAVTSCIDDRKRVNNERYEFKDEKSEKLLELVKFIEAIVQSKSEYKKLPQPRGGYL